MVVDMHGRRSRDIVDKAITALLNLEHRGAQGAEPHSGDGAGIMIQVPDRFLRSVVEFELPPAGSYATGIAFLPQSSKDAAAACAAVEKIVEAEGCKCSAGETCPPTTLRWARCPATRCPRSGSCSSPGPRV
ncbi:glutamine amidotransferases class-II family protein [Mycobacterium xenopi 4042]|uniref:Glutamine amidotransferases class-II family protein n=1 Tax=Mycobacterium xenopi 4042 TaxID=1299334 RepID=X8CKX9_MYCXE|nr:glutamine amidotransferases class-II family protein [Mycobacterium xenopi 4042]